MSASDLTRWNRAGLRRVRYVGGNAVEYLERLREALVAAFPDWPVVQAADADSASRARRILAQYKAETGDVAWEIVRSFARAVHVQAATLDAYANETYLETTTQWEHLRRLAAMIGYAPALPSSASTPLVVFARPAAVGTLGAGFAVAATPAGGGPPVVFETLSDLAIDAALNEIRPARWNRSEETFDPAGEPGWMGAPLRGLHSGQPAVLLQEPPLTAAPGMPPVAAAAHAVTVALVEPESARLVLDRDPAFLTTDWRRGFTRVMAGPRRLWRPHLNGAAVFGLDRDAGLHPGDVLAWSGASGWSFGRIAAVQGRRLMLADGNRPPLAAALFLATMVVPVVDPRSGTTGGEFRVPLALQAAARVEGDGPLVALDIEGADSAFVHSGDPQAPTAGYQTLRSPSPAPAALLIVAAAARPIAHAEATAAATPWTYTFDGAPAALASGDWLVAEFAQPDGRRLRRPCRVGRLEAIDGGFTLQLLDASAGAAEPAATRALLATLRRLEGLLDQTSFDGLRLEELLAGVLAQRPVHVIAGIADGGAYGRVLRDHGIATVAELAAMPQGDAVAGLSAVRLRQFRSAALQIVEAPASLQAPAAWLGRRLAELVQLEAVPVAGPTSDPGVLEQLFGPFTAMLRPTGWDHNLLEVPDRARITLDLAPSAAPAALRPGRTVVVEPDTAWPAGALQTQIRAVDLSGPLVAVTLADALPPSVGFRLGAMVLRGNVVTAGHGESQPERLLGSGNAAARHQSFVLPVAGVATVADSTMPSGVRADLAVVVDGQTWQAVDSLARSGPADPHHTVRLTEAGHLRIAFGDGVRGRRLPSGVNNLRVRFRLGVGAAGNLPALSLAQPARPDPRIGALRQPLSAIGGSDMEGLESVRRNAPASVLTMERAVSLPDYGHLAASQSGIWQARSFARAAGGRQQRVEVVIVPAHGAPMDPDFRVRIPAGFLADQRAFLQRHAPVGVAVTVSAYEPVLVDLAVELGVRSDRFEPSGVVDRVRAALWTAFALERRRLGQPLQIGELFEVVENTAGVEYSRIVLALATAPTGLNPPHPMRIERLADDGPVQTLVAGQRQVIHLDARHSNVVVTAREYAL